MTQRTVLALDLATNTGWAEGEIGALPRFGSTRFAPAGSAPAAIFGGAIQWLGTRLQAFRPHVIAYEAPFAPSVMRGHTNANTARILLGLPAVMEGVSYRMGVHNLMEASVGDVRQHFIGTRRLKSAEAKRAVIQRCRDLALDVQDDNQADAVALWFFITAVLDQRTSARSSPLFIEGSNVKN